MKYQPSIILFSFLITQIIAKIPEEPLIIDFNGNYTKNYENVNETYFQIKIISENLPKYLKIQISNFKESQNPNYIMTFNKSNDESSEREQISTGENSALMWLTQQQLDKENNLLYVSCYTFPCNYTLNLLSCEEINLDLNSQFNLYVTNNNKELDVSFSSENEELNYPYITLWAIGNKNPEVTLSEGYEYKKYSKNNIFKISSNASTESIYVLKIKAEIGDVINIGANSFSGDNLENSLINNSPEKKGFIIKNFYNKEECYMINIDRYDLNENYYISGLVYTKIAEIYYKDQNGEIINNSINIINNGSFINIINPSKENKKYFCLRFPSIDGDKYDFDEIFYSIQLTDPKQSDSKINLYSQQIIGEIYPRMLKEEEIFIYKGIPISDDTTEISFEMIKEFGLPDMYFDICTNYPLCDNYKYNNLKELKNPIGINGQSSYKLSNINKYSPMDKNQYVLIVKCTKSKYEKGLPCGFRTLYNTNNNKINLKEKELFSQYIKEREKNLYNINFSGQKDIEKIYIDLMVFTGDIIVNLTETNIIAKKLYNANKIFFIITADQITTNQEINLNVIGSKNSYYSIKYMLVRKNDDSWITNIIESGVSYLVTIDPEGKDSSGEIKPYKYIKFPNLNLYEKVHALVNFNSLNCKLNVTAKRFKEDGSSFYEPIEAYDQYYQDVVFKNKENDYEYMLTIDEMDFSVYNNKLCMVYASSLEMKKEDLNESQIVISDNEPKQIVFKNNLKVNVSDIEYLYPHTDKNNDVVIKFNFLDIAKYTIQVSYNFEEYSNYTQTGNDLIYLHHNEWENVKTTSDLLPIIIKVIRTRTFEEKEPELVISVKVVQDNTPSYIKKNEAIIDFLLGNNTQYFYTDLGKGEEGFALVNYRRGSGRIFGKIVQKNLDKPEEGANWREMYKFPETVEESIEFNGYVKKILIKKEETDKCDDGCYLLLTLKTSILANTNTSYDFREFPFNIMIYTINPTSETIKDTIPIIDIPLNEYIVGNIIINKDNQITEFYSTYFTHDAESILIDFQSKVVNFVIKVGMDNKPSKDDKDYYFESIGDDTIFNISKKDFLDKCKIRGIAIPHENSFLGLGMTIGIWTNKTDSLYTTVYSLKVNLPFHESDEDRYQKLNIIEVLSDQKTLCKPLKLYDQDLYRCLFVVFYLGIDPINHLLIYPETQDNTPYEMYAHFIYQEKYEFYDYTYLRTEIPNEGSDYSTKKSGLDYIYIEHADIYNRHLYISIVSKYDSIIELYTSFYTNDFQLSPNPSSPQLFLVDNKFMFEFTTEEDLLVTIKTICGIGKIQWHSDEGVEYYLSGRDKVLSLSSSITDKTDPKKVFSNLDVTSLYKDVNCTGFSFHISFLLRPPKINIDGIPLGKSTRMAYREADLPVYIYTEIWYYNNDVQAFINIYELLGEMEGGLQSIVPFELSAAVVNDTVIMDAKLNKEILDGINFEFKGVYDPMIKTGFVLITKEDIKRKNILPNDGPSVILKINKNMNYPKMKDTTFTRLTLEASIIQDNTDIPAVPDTYQFGKLSLNADKNIYRLKTCGAEEYMRIEFSSGSDKLKYVIGLDESATSTFGFKEYTDENINGKQVITFNSNSKEYPYLYLIIYHQSDKASTNKITNYVFKYMTSKNKNGFEEYKLNHDQGFELDKKKDGDDFIYTFKITPLPYQNVDITYFIKFTSKKDWIENEKDNSIALKESKSYVEEFTKYDLKDDKIVREYKIKKIDYRYVQVIAMVKSKGNYEYVGYGSIYVKDQIWWKILLIVLAAIIVAVVVIYLIRMYLKWKKDINRQLEGLEGTMVSRYTEASVD